MFSNLLVHEEYRTWGELGFYDRCKFLIGPGQFRRGARLSLQDLKEWYCKNLSSAPEGMGHAIHILLFRYNLFKRFVPPSSIGDRLFAASRPNADTWVESLDMTGP